jgi:hypothetical protein
MGSSPLVTKHKNTAVPVIRRHTVIVPFPINMQSYGTKINIRTLNPEPLKKTLTAKIVWDRMKAVLVSAAIFP